MNFKNILLSTAVVTLSSLAIAATANAKGIPLMNYTCGSDISVHADKGGPVYINAKQAKLKKVNANFYEATGSGITVSISFGSDGEPSLSYTGKRGVNGVCNEAMAGNHSHSSSSTKLKKGNTPENLYSSVPPKLKDLVGAKAGQAEDDLISRGYTYKNTVTFDGGKSAYYVENKTGYCVEVGTTEGRFNSIVYNSSDRCAKK
ncbi:MAG: hypothetical protein ACRC6M_02890 [Microcystaceae cyanobacterium]